MKKIKKYIDYCITKFDKFLHEKKFSSNNTNLKYLYKPYAGSEVLIVVFSACTRAGVKARYNYVRTLKSVKANCLFILDDFAEDGRGAYYLGHDCGNEIEVATINLINKFKSRCNPDKLVFCGSSKGGWAALNFMTSFPGSVAIVGAPQYKLANYLLAPALEKCRNYVMPNPTKDKIDYLNNYLKSKLENACNNNNKIYLHFSNKEHTYNEHICYLIEDLIKFNYDFESECLDYTDHWDVSLYYPKFLLNCINQILN